MFPVRRSSPRALREGFLGGVQRVRWIEGTGARKSPDMLAIPSRTFFVRPKASSACTRLKASRSVLRIHVEEADDASFFA